MKVRIFGFSFFRSPPDPIKKKERMVSKLFVILEKKEIEPRFVLTYESWFLRSSEAHPRHRTYKKKRKRTVSTVHNIKKIKKPKRIIRTYESLGFSVIRKPSRDTEPIKKKKGTVSKLFHNNKKEKKNFKRFVI